MGGDFLFCCVLFFLFFLCFFYMFNMIKFRGQLSTCKHSAAPMVTVVLFCASGLCAQAERLMLKGVERHLLV